MRRDVDYIYVPLLSVKTEFRVMETVNKGGFRKHILLAVILVLVLAAGSCAIWYITAGRPVNSKSKSVQIVNIEQGTGASSIGQTLKSKGLIRSSAAFRIYGKLNGTEDEYQAGTYGISKSMSIGEIAKMIASGKTRTVSVTIPEGLTEYQIARRFSNAGLVKYDDFVKALEDGSYRSKFSFLKGAQKGKHYLEGYLFPDTYSVSPGTSSDAIITMMLKSTQSQLEALKAEKNLPKGYSLNEVMTAASIIEKESQVDKDRAKIASVIYNRLKKDMPLQMDSTITYLLDQTGEHKTEVTYQDLKIDSPYNTYKNTGLPPGPIASPGKASIQAALHPADTDYLYFVVSSKLDGSHVFSSSYSQFNKDKAAYSKALEDQKN